MNTVPSNYRVLDGDRVVAFFVHSAHVLSFIESCNRPVEQFTVQYISGNPADADCRFTDLSLKYKLSLCNQ